jgi:ketosteroid isomerase-like protein
VAKFYEAFARLDAETMGRCYADDVVFSDPAFGTLKGDAVRDMWRMLTARAQAFSLALTDVAADDRTGVAHWRASYVFTQTGRVVTNRVEARFTFRDGSIAEHHDTFDLWRWARQALGVKGALLGWSPLVQHAVRTRATKALQMYRAGTDTLPAAKPCAFALARLRRSRIRTRR